MLVKFFSQALHHPLADGADRSIGKRAGPLSWSCPQATLTSQTPCIDAEFLAPQSQRNSSNRISFDVSLEFATEAEAQRFANVDVKALPYEGTLLCIDEIDGTMQRYENACRQEINPRQEGVAVDVRYTFICGRQVHMGTTPLVPTGVVAVPQPLAVDILWAPALGADAYHIWSYQSAEGWKFVAEIPVNGFYYLHQTNDQIYRLYFVRSITNYSGLSALSSGSGAAGLPP